MLRLAKKPNRVTIDIDFGSGFFFVIGSDTYFPIYISIYLHIISEGSTNLEYPTLREVFFWHPREANRLSSPGLRRSQMSQALNASLGG
jgi:hypothetical protein